MIHRNFLICLSTTVLPNVLSVSLENTTAVAEAMAAHATYFSSGRAINASIVHIAVLWFSDKYPAGTNVDPWVWTDVYSNLQMAVSRGIRLWWENTMMHAPRTSPFRYNISYWSVGLNPLTIATDIQTLVGSLLYANPNPPLAIIAPAGLSGTIVSIICETTKLCITMAPMSNDPASVLCTIPEGQPTLPPDCFGKNTGERRFSMTLNPRVSDSTFSNQLISWLYAKGAKTFAFLVENTVFGRAMWTEVARLCKSLGLTVQSQQWFTPPATNTAFPKNSEVQEALETVARSSTSTVDVLLVLASFGSTTYCARVMTVLKDMDWMPSKALGFPGGCLQSTPLYEPRIFDERLMDQVVASTPWDYRLRGDVFRVIKSLKQPWVPWEATDVDDSPQVFGRDSTRRWGDVQSGEYVLHAIGALTVYSIQRALETASLAKWNAAALDNSRAQLLMNSLEQLYEPSFMGIMAFQKQRAELVYSPFHVQQFTFDNEYTLKTPAESSTPAIYPITSWKERRMANLDYLSRWEETVVLSITILVLAQLAILFGLVLWNRKTTAIQAVSPFFVSVMLMGQIFIAIGASQWRLHSATDQSCQSAIVLVSIGFQIVFGSLVVKTYRIGRIFDQTQLKRVTISDSMLVFWLAVFLFVDGIIFTAWSVVDPIRATMNKPDPLRLNTWTMQCVINERFSVAILVLRCFVIFVTIFITFKARNVTKGQFNEDTHIYNAGFVSAVIIAAITALSLGSTNSSVLYIGQTLGLLLIASSTALIMLLPRFWLLWGVQKTSMDFGSTEGRDAPVQNNKSNQETRGPKNNVMIVASSKRKHDSIVSLMPIDGAGAGAAAASSQNSKAAEVAQSSSIEIIAMTETNHSPSIRAASSDFNQKPQTSPSSK